MAPSKALDLISNIIYLFFKEGSQKGISCRSYKTWIHLSPAPQLPTHTHQPLCDIRPQCSSLRPSLPPPPPPPPALSQVLPSALSQEPIQRVAVPASVPLSCLFFWLFLLTRL